MGYFGQFYLDKEKDLVVRLDMEGQALRYTLYANNHRSDNLINNFARIAGAETSMVKGRRVITGPIPCYIKGDGQRLYILRLSGTKLANIYPDGTIQVNSVVPAIAKTLMSQTKDYGFSFRETLVKSYVPERIKLTTDLHTHGNANLSADILIALAIKHQIRYPLYYIKKLGLTLTEVQKASLEQQRDQVAQTLDLAELSEKHRNRRIDDNTFINFADLILNNLTHSGENIRRIRISLSILKDSQAVFTNLEKLYLYRYVFTKGVPCRTRIALHDMEQLEDPDIRGYLKRMLLDQENPHYKDNTLYEDTLLWIGRSYQQKHIRYLEISDTTLVKKDASCPRMLEQVHRILPLVKAETGVDIRFLAAIRRIPLTLVKDSITTGSYLKEAMEALLVVSQDPYVVGSDFVGEEITDIGELKAVIREIVTKIAARDPDWTIRIHAGENDTLKSNMAKSIDLVEEALLPGQAFPHMRIGHGLYCAKLSSKQGRQLIEKIKTHDVTLEFQLSSNVRLNNLTDLRRHPLKTYLAQDIPCVMGTDGWGLYGTDGIDEQLALSNFLGITEAEFLKMKAAEDRVVRWQEMRFARRSAVFQTGGKSVAQFYREALAASVEGDVDFEIRSRPSYPVLKDRVKELPWDKYPIIIAGSSFSQHPRPVSPGDKELLNALVERLDPKKVFFVLGHKLLGHERYLLEHNRGFDIYCMVPALMMPQQLRRLEKAPITGIRISTETQEMGLYKSFNYELFERRNSVLFAFDGNTAAANLIQEARNGKGKTYIFIAPNSPILKAKAASLQGYVTLRPKAEEALAKVQQLQEDIGERR